MQPSDFTPGAADPVQSKINQIRSLIAGYTDSSEEKQVVNIFRGSTPRELNQMLSTFSRDELSTVLNEMEAHLFGADNKDELLTLLSENRVSDLSIDSKIKIIEALQEGRTEKVEEKAIRNIFLSAKGEALTAIKNGIDQTGDYHDLQQLLFHDIDSSHVREAILEHIKSEAPPKGSRAMVFSDIDDTFYVNWKDTRYPKKTVYPGVRAFYQELSRGASTSGSGGQLYFLSARPFDRPAFFEEGTREMLEEHNVHQATVLSGSFHNLTSNESIAEKKYENWEQLEQLYPEYGSLFVGDSGQGDAIFGERAAASKGDMRGVFIHNVTNLSPEERADFAKKKVFIFDTYVGAATEAFRRGFISADGLERVITAAKNDFSKTEFGGPRQQEDRQAELQRDVDEARSVLNAAS